MLNPVKQAATSILVKVAKADGKIDEHELNVLKEFTGDESYHHAVEQAEKSDLASLASEISKAEDRFFIRLRAQLMAEADGVVDTAEQSILDQLVADLPLPKELESLLGDVIEQELEGTINVDLAKIEQLYHQSSFAS